MIPDKRCYKNNTRCINVKAVYYRVLNHGFERSLAMESLKRPVKGAGSGCAPSVEPIAGIINQSHDRDRSTTQTASLIAASFRT